MTRWLSRALLWMASRLVPRDQRGEWLEEWLAEVEALEELRETSPTAAGLPGPVRFVLGAVPHALWTRTEGWTMESVWQDLRFGARVLRRSPGFTLVAALTLALGIGANASIFSLINGLLFRPPGAIAQPERLVQVARSYETAPRWDNFSFPAVELIRREADVFSGVAAYSGAGFTIGSGAETEQVFGQYASGSYFDVLGVRPAAGRLLRPDDDVEPGAHRVVVLGHELWVRRFGGDPSVVGRILPIGAVPYEIVGVAPRGFAGPESIGSPPALWIPVVQREVPPELSLTQEWGFSWLSTVARMADGVTFPQARTAMEVVSTRLREATTQNGDMEVLLAEGIGLDPEGREEGEQLSMILFVIVGVVLLLTCTNVANLFLARATGRRAEVGVRLALGAGRGRLARQLLTESLLLALLGTALAVPMVLLAEDFLPAVFPYTLAVSVGADGAVWLFLAAVGVTTGLLFGAAPAWTAARRDLAAGLREAAGTGNRSRHRLRDGLVVVQLGLSLGLVSAAALLGRSVLNAATAEPGFQARGMQAVPLNLFSTGRYDEETGTDLYRRLVEGAEAIPGVRSAAVANQMPIAGGHSRASVQPPGRGDLNFEAEYIVVGDGYFETLQIPLLEGRVLGPDEVEQVVVVNQTLAELFWPGESAVGKELERRGSWRVVGVVGDVQMRSLRSRPNPAVYYPLAREWSPFMVLHVTTRPGAALAPTRLRELVTELDSELPVAQVVDVQQAVVASMGESRTIGFLVAAFAGLALVLAAVGLYGVVSFTASQRVRELGIRKALGAAPPSLVRLLLGRGAGIALLGVALGVGVSFLLGAALRSLLFGVAPGDVLILTSASLFLLATAGVASWIPARRASRVDAAVTLREGG